MKKVIILFLSLAFIFPSALPTQAADEICGMDGTTYLSEAAAEEAGTELDYDFACVNPTSEEGLFEETEEFNFAGMLKEVGSTDIPTTLIVSRNSDGEDFTIEVNETTVLGQQRDQYTSLSDWIPGDQIRVIGERNTNTENIEASVLVNLSIRTKSHRGANGWITEINTEAKTITYQWANKNYIINYGDDTKFVVGLKNPASVEDLLAGDRIRGRLLMRQCITAPCYPLAKIIVVLRRGEDLFMKIRTFRPNATLVRLDSTVVPTTIQVRIDRTPGLRADDVNNLIGTEGTLLTVNISEDTKLVRKYFGRSTLDEFSVNDRLFIVGRVNDDGTVDAKVIKNNSIWMTSSRGHAGVVTAIDTVNNYLMVDWTPIRYKTRHELKAQIQSSDTALSAQMLNTTALQTATISAGSIGAKLKARLKRIKAVTVGKLKRRVVNKRIKIDRIKHSNLRIGNLIQRLPIRNIRVDVNENTVIVVGTNVEASIGDIQVGDKVRVRGIKHATLPLVTAQTIVVVSSLPEIDEPLESELDDINAVVSVIDTDSDEDEIVGDTATATEEEVDTTGSITEEDDDSSQGVSGTEDNSGDDESGENS